ncbi:hypothetical protein FPQ18DRAFT_336662 [Pyronema domesticum]|uniref:Similar to NADH-cytochrome b5 reductase 2 acc. no. Q6CS27 n=1 Tax=Pyronema omphalodes (strain CBS 100304) TaxID=1076935 RepID=U4L772_PYROM|nr:hypothetical protein FPQ18DRAFT_336662 [Pyronema domesticum]CCX13028.1 Similar to NADH-cytochrome b5 reductase 2; acc. no. Q6CS27 [Pyronema omphalodes CBS 100304]
MSLPRLLRPACRRFASTSARPEPLKPTKTRRLLYPATFVIGSAAGILFFNYSPPAKQSLNPETFTAYTLTSHVPITTSPSQTSILTLLPPGNSPPPPFVPSKLQSIEIKNPYVQIARHYTPLPSKDDKIRLLIKREPDGEMSRYLFTLKPGATIELRGPHTEYELHPAAHASKLLFLAGGTGIAPALQCAQKLLDSSENASMRILWAVRHRSETEGAVSEELEKLKRAYGGRLQVGIFSDEEGGIGQGMVKDAVLSWGARRVLISGPDGFIGYWAGPKGDWVMGKESQGEVRGVLGPLHQQKGIDVWKL